MPDSVHPVYDCGRCIAKADYVKIHTGKFGQDHIIYDIFDRTVPLYRTVIIQRYFPDIAIDLGNRFLHGGEINIHTQRTKSRNKRIKHRIDFIYYGLNCVIQCCVVFSLIIF